MNNIEKLLAIEFELLKAEIIAKYHDNDTVATGQWPQTLNITVKNNTAAISGAGYINGRSPGKAPPSEAIEKWLVVKGIAAQTEQQISTSSLAFLIARKIALHGWQPKQGRENFTENAVSRERLEQMAQKIGGELLPDYILLIETLLNLLKT